MPKSIGLDVRRMSKQGRLISAGKTSQEQRPELRT